MAAKKKVTVKVKEKQEALPAVVVPPKKELVLEGDPQAQLDFAMKAANALMNAVNQKPKKVIIRGEQYLEYGDWQTLARFFGATASVAWTRPIEGANSSIRGYEARAEVLHNGVVISSAEAMCTREEANWKSRDEFMLRSMAQTRASAKALRNAYGWVAELAGMKSTPAEEMGELYDRSPVAPDVIPTVTYDEDTPRENPAAANRPSFMSPTKRQLTQEEILKGTIKRLVDDMVLVPLEGAEEYRSYVHQRTGLLLVPENYKTIIQRLEALR